MIKKLICLSAFMATIFPLALNAQVLEKGNIKAITVEGEVTLTDQDTGSVSPLKKGKIFRDGTVINTGKDSNAVFVLSNGSSIRVGPNSVLEVTEFEQEPFDASMGSYLALTEDPSMSRTDLLLKSGSIVGETKHLSPSSEYVINTPVGSAGIRGTSFGVELMESLNDSGATVYDAFFTNIEGNVFVETPGGSGNIMPGEQVGVTGTPEGVTMSNPAPAPPEIIEQVVELKNTTSSEAAPEIVTPPAPPTQDQSDPSLEVSPAGGR